MAEQNWLKDIWYQIAIYGIDMVLFILNHWLALLITIILIYAVSRPIYRRMKRARCC